MRNSSAESCLSVCFRISDSEKWKHDRSSKVDENNCKRCLLSQLKLQSIRQPKMIKKTKSTWKTSKTVRLHVVRCEIHLLVCSFLVDRQRRFRLERRIGKRRRTRLEWTQTSSSVSWSHWYRWRITIQTETNEIREKSPKGHGQTRFETSSRNSSSDHQKVEEYFVRHPKAWRLQESRLGHVHRLRRGQDRRLDSTSTDRCRQPIQKPFDKQQC